MKIEVAPCDYVADMDALYSELTLERLEEKPFRTSRRILSNYKELFDENSGDESKEHNMDPETFSSLPKNKISSTSIQKTKIQRKKRKAGKRILAKGDPGMGKSTLAKKIAWDWAKGFFTAYSIVFFVFLKLVKPGDAIENVIIKQMPILQGRDVTPTKLQKILESFGDRCLIIFDGLDEHAFGQNEDVLRMIRGKKYLFCSMIVTSRPHSITDVEMCFPNIVRVDGFTQNEAKKFASRILHDVKTAEKVLNFNPGNIRQNIPLYKCPLILSFLCFLVREGGVDILSTAMTIGEIYTRMVRALYKKFTIRKGINFVASLFIEAVANTGKLAFETLLTGNPFLSRSKVIETVGADGFDYGFLIGHEDFCLKLDETADIFVTFAHRSIQEFFGAFFFIWTLSRGNSIEHLLGYQGDPIFLTNPLFLHFCLWFLKSDQVYFTIENADQIYRNLLDFVKQSIDRSAIGRAITATYPALDLNGTDKHVEDFTEEVLDIMCRDDTLQKTDEIKRKSFEERSHEWSMASTSTDAKVSSTGKKFYSRLEDLEITNLLTAHVIILMEKH